MTTRSMPLPRKAMERKTGARVCVPLSRPLLDTMYDLPSRERVSKVVIDETVIGRPARPDDLRQS